MRPPYHLSNLGRSTSEKSFTTTWAPPFFSASLLSLINKNKNQYKKVVKRERRGCTCYLLYLCPTRVQSDLCSLPELLIGHLLPESNPLYIKNKISVKGISNKTRENMKSNNMVLKSILE